MDRSPLEYQSGRSWLGSRLRRPLFVLILAALVLSTASFLFSLNVRQDLGWVDAVTGSEKYQTDWVFGMTTGRRTVPSPIELRLRKMGVTVQPDWRNVMGTYRNLFGNSTGHAHGWPAPAIYPFRGDEQQGFVDTSSDAEILTFVRVMQSGTEPAKREAVDATVEKSLAAPARPGG